MSNEEFILKASELTTNNSASFTELLSIINDYFNTHYSSLWNFNSDARSLSLLSSEGVERNTRNRFEYVHDVHDSFSKLIIDSKTPYISIDNIQLHNSFQKHKSQERIKNLGCKKCLIIKSFGDEIKNDQLKLILFIYPKFEISENTYIMLFLNNLLNQISKDYYLEVKNNITSNIIDLHKRKGDADLKVLMKAVINDNLKRIIPFEAFSLFIWDSFKNHLALGVSTGIEGAFSEADIYYNLGEGLTGTAAEMNTFSLHNRNIKHLKELKRTFREIKPNKAESILLIPLRKSSTNELLGIVRFVNRVNSVYPHLDYFSELDVHLLTHACYLLGLYIEFENKDKMFSDFSRHMVHELRSPIIGISGMSKRLQQNLFNRPFLDKYLANYVTNISEIADLQIAQTESIHLSWRTDTKISKSEIYSITETDLRKDVIEKSRKLIFPILRDQNLKYDDIIVQGSYPILYIDKNAFIQIFINLLTNCIKYRDLETVGYQGFRVVIEINFRNDFKFGPGYYIDIIDNGIGVPIGEVDKIFKLGYRVKNNQKFDVKGLGIGLSVVRNILIDFGGNIRVKSNSRPTILSIFLPEKLKNYEYTRESRWNEID